MNADASWAPIAPVDLDRIEGASSAVKMKAMTTADGAPLMTPIDGVMFRPARAVSHDRGYLTEVYRTDWDLTDLPVVQVNMTTTYPGQIRGWGLHRCTVDRLFAATGSLCIVVIDGRTDSPTFGAVNQFFLGSHNQGLVLIPPGLWHGWKNIGAGEATIISMPSNLYNHIGPDRWELPWNSPEAQSLIPYRWPNSP